ncbi:Peptidase S8/S53 domain [Trinorchestia longiramus]|nr:Peptidase S8/S53 domain [Trinorchestia longiramus]
MMLQSKSPYMAEFTCIQQHFSIIGQKTDTFNTGQRTHTFSTRYFQHTFQPEVNYFTRKLCFVQRNVGQNGGKRHLDLNVEAAWALGYTGKNVTTAIMDDGVDYMHEDLKRNYNGRASWDFSSNDPYPYPRYTDDWFNR